MKQFEISCSRCGKRKRTAKVYCEKCNSSTASYTDFRKDGTFLFDAIDAWNRRAGEEGKHE